MENQFLHEKLETNVETTREHHRCSNCSVLQSLVNCEKNERWTNYKKSNLKSLLIRYFGAKIVTIRVLRAIGIVNQCLSDLAIHFCPLMQAFVNRVNPLMSLAFKSMFLLIFKYKNCQNILVKKFQYFKWFDNIFVSFNASVC